MLLDYNWPFYLQGVPTRLLSELHFHCQLAVHYGRISEQSTVSGSAKSSNSESNFFWDTQCLFFRRWSKAMRMLLEGDFGPITWKRRSYLYEQGLLLRQVLVIDHDDDDDDHFDHMGKKKLSVQAWSSDQWGSIYQWSTMLILGDEKFEGEMVMLGPSWHGTRQLWKGGINSLYTCYLSNLKRSRILKNVVQWERKQFTIFQIMKNLQMQSLCMTRPGVL